MEEKDAILRIKQGDLNGLEVLVNQYQVKAVYSAYLILQDRTMAEEVVQNAFLKAVEKIHSFDDSRSFSPWFLRIVVNDSIQLTRERKKLVQLYEEPDDETKTLACWLIDSNPSPEYEVEEKERVVSLRKAMNSLTPEQREAVVLRYYLQMSEKEVSNKLAKPLKTVRWWLRSARNRLKSLLRVDGDMPIQ